MNFSFGSHSLGINAPNPGINYSYNGYGISSNLNTHGVSKSWSTDRFNHQIGGYSDGSSIGARYSANANSGCEIM